MCLSHCVPNPMTTKTCGKSLKPNLDTIPSEADDEYSVIEHTWWAGVCGGLITSESAKSKVEKVNEKHEENTSFAGSLLQLGKLGYLWTG